METKLGFSLPIADILAKILHALVLVYVLNFLLYVSKFMQAHLQIIQKIGHWIVHKIEVVNVLLKDLCAFKLV